MSNQVISQSIAKTLYLQLHVGLKNIEGLFLFDTPPLNCKIVIAKMGEKQYK